MKTSQLDPRDHKYIIEGGDPGFNPDRNKAIIAKTIRDAEAYNKAQWYKWRDQLGERAEAAAYYLKHVDRNKSTSVENYFGRNELARLRGDDIRMDLLSRLAMRNED